MAEWLQKENVMEKLNEKMKGEKETRKVGNARYRSRRSVEERQRVDLERRLEEEEERCEDPF